MYIWVDAGACLSTRIDTHRSTRSSVVVNFFLPVYVRFNSRPQPYGRKCLAITRFPQY